MGKSLSNDLRLRVVEAVKGGLSRRASAARLSVSESSAIRFVRLYTETGSVAPKPRGRPKGGGKLAPHREWLIKQVEAEPDITMLELAARLLEEHGVKVDPSNLSKLLCKAGFTYKKSPDGSGTRARRCEPCPA